jgi:hypothetical protein
MPEMKQTDRHTQKLIHVHHYQQRVWNPRSPTRHRRIQNELHTCIFTFSYIYDWTNLRTWKHWSTLLIQLHLSVIVYTVIPRGIQSYLSVNVYKVTPRGIQPHLSVIVHTPKEYSFICSLLSIHPGEYIFIYLLLSIHPGEYSFICLLFSILSEEYRFNSL